MFAAALTLALAADLLPGAVPAALAAPVDGARS